MLQPQIDSIIDIGELPYDDASGAHNEEFSLEQFNDQGNHLRSIIPDASCSPGESYTTVSMLIG